MSKLPAWSNSVRALLRTIHNRPKVIIVAALCLSVPVTAMAAWVTGEKLYIDRTGYIGSSNSIGGDWHLAVGYSNTGSQCYRSIVIGTFNQFNAMNSLVVGTSNSGGGTNSITVGTSNNSDHSPSNSLILGTGTQGMAWRTQTQSYGVVDAIIGGRYNQPRVPEGLGDLLLAIGNGTSNTARNNVIEAFADGTVIAPSRVIVNDNEHSTGDALAIRKPPLPETPNTLSNSFRITANGVVLVSKQGDIGMGAFDAGERP